MSNLASLLAQATNPKSYDADDVNWENENGMGSRRQELYREYFNFPESWTGKSVLDVGCGTGWLCNFFKQNGAADVTGIEPSQKNLEYAKATFKGIDFQLSDLLSYSTDKKYYFISSIMMLMNIASLQAAFAKLYELTQINGELVIVIPDFDYFKTPRNGYDIELEIIDDDSYVEKVRRPNFTVVDIIRKNHCYRDAAKYVGYKLLQETPLLPTSNFRSDLLQYEEFKDKPIMHLMRFAI